MLGHRLEFRSAGKYKSTSVHSSSGSWCWLSKLTLQWSWGFWCSAEETRRDLYDMLQPLQDISYHTNSLQVNTPFNINWRNIIDFVEAEEYWTELKICISLIFCTLYRVQYDTYLRYYILTVPWFIFFHIASIAYLMVNKKVFPLAGTELFNEGDF
jgi:hypothetical protein